MAAMIDYAAHMGITHANLPPEHDEFLGRQRIALLSRAGIGPDASILEIGPGLGGLQRAFRAAGYGNAHAIEADKTLAQRLRNADLPVDWCAVDETIPFLERHAIRFDAICLFHVLEHVEKSQQIALVAAIRNALKPGGVILCEVPNADSPVATYFRYGDWTHQCLFGVTSLQFVLEAAGFGAVEIHPVAGGPPPESKIAMLAANMLRGLSHGAHRLHLLAELGARGLKIPVTAAIVATARNTAP